jgi:predicted Zn-dependent protease
MMKRTIIALLPFLAALMLPACSSVPITGRSQLNFIPDSEMFAMSYSQYDEFLKSSKLSDDEEATAMVKRVGTRIRQAVEGYFQDNGMSGRLDGYKWEFNLIENDEVNAWAMPGGKVVVYEGILPVTRTETGLAVVMGHEIAHAVAEHGSERMSQVLIAQLGGMALSEALASKPEETKNLWLSVYGVGTQVGVLLPYSRTHESEADHLGLIFMAMAGYDPREAVDFWQRMADKGGPSPPELLSTHPADETRVRNLRENLPEALKYYENR